MGAPQKATLQTLLEVANRAYDQVNEAISALDEKAGTLVDFSAVVTGLYLIAGIGIRDLATASCVTYRTLAFASLFLGVGTGIAALLISIYAWRLAKIEILELPAVVKRLGSSTVEFAQSYLISQVSHRYQANIAHNQKQKNWVRGAMTVLAVSVGNVGAFISLAALAITSGCG